MLSEITKASIRCKKDHNEEYDQSDNHRLLSEGVLFGHRKKKECFKEKYGNS